MGEPVIIGNKHVQVGIDPARTGKDASVVSIVCTLCGASQELSRVTDLDHFREQSTTFAGLHWDCRWNPRPGYAPSDGPPVDMPTSTKPNRREHVPHRENRLLYTETGDPEA